jgi:hypothetical protein
MPKKSAMEIRQAGAGRILNKLAELLNVDKKLLDGRTYMSARLVSEQDRNIQRDTFNRIILLPLHLNFVIDMNNNLLDCTIKPINGKYIEIQYGGHNRRYNVPYDFDANVFHRLAHTEIIRATESNLMILSNNIRKLMTHNNNINKYYDFNFGFNPKDSYHFLDYIEDSKLQPYTN